MQRFLGTICETWVQNIFDNVSILIAIPSRLLGSLRMLTDKIMVGRF